MSFDRAFLLKIGGTADGLSRWKYSHPSDLLAEILTNGGYFDGANDIIKAGDAIVLDCIDAKAETNIETSIGAGTIRFDQTPFAVESSVGGAGSVDLIVQRNTDNVRIVPSGGGVPAVIDAATVAAGGILSTAQALQLANLGTASTRSVGTSIGNIPELDASGLLPASTIPSSGGGSVTSVAGQAGVVTTAQLRDAFDVLFGSTAWRIAAPIDSVVGSTGVISTTDIINAFNTALGGTAWQGAGGGGAVDSVVGQTGAVTSAQIRDALDLLFGNSAWRIAAPVNSVAGQTGAVTTAAISNEISAQFDVNFLTNAEQTKLAGIETAATADQSNLEIETAYNAQVDIVPQAVAEAGTSAAVFRWSPQRINQAVQSLSPGGTAGVTSVAGLPGPVITAIALAAALPANGIGAAQLSADVGRYGTNSIRNGPFTLEQDDENEFIRWTGGTPCTIPLLAASSQFQIKRKAATDGTLTVTGAGVTFDVEGTPQTSFTLPAGKTVTLIMPSDGSNTIELLGGV